MAKVTYNKDGTPRKSGSGRKKGSISLITIKLRDLIAAGLNDNDDVVVGKKFKDEVFKKNVDKPELTKDTSSSAADAVQEKIAFKITTFD